MDFEGADDLRRAWLSGLAPDPVLTVSQWADRHRILTSRGASESGPYRTSRVPYLREVMDCLSVSNPAERIVFMKSAQIGATEAGINWIGYVIHHVPGPFLLVEAGLDTVKKVSAQKVEPLIETTPEVRERIPPARSRDGGNTTTNKLFPGGVLALVGANSAAGLRSMPARYLFLDEVDSYPGDLEAEGDPVALAVARTLSFGRRRKIFLASTPTVQGVSRIEREWEQSDQRRYFVPCPHCGHMQWLRFERLRWEPGRPDSVSYHCEGCEAAIAERHKTEMLAAGEWRATAPDEIAEAARRNHVVGFHLSALYSPLGWFSWEMMAQEHEAARGSEPAMKAFRNTRLGELWVERGDAPEWERIYERREEIGRGVVPWAGLLLTAGIDVQQDRLEAYVWAWGRDRESWLIDRVVTEAGPEDEAAWAELSELLRRPFRHESGASLLIERVGADTGYLASRVYNWSRLEGPSVVAPVKGEEGFDRAAPVTGPTFVDVTLKGRRLRRGARLWHVATAVFKSEFYRDLRLARPTDEDLEQGNGFPSGYVHVPTWADAEIVRQMTAEQLMLKRDARGYQKRIWHKVRERNEALDCRVYARAACWLAGIDRWTDEQWQEREADIMRSVPTPETGPARPTAAAAAPGWMPRQSERWL